MAYKVYCRECSWTVTDPVELKGEANWLAGRHISDTDHSVALEEVDDETTDAEFVRGDGERGRIEILRPNPDPASDHRRRCGPVECSVQTVRPPRSA